ncbi:golgin subfamily A member 6-like protein 1 [Argopecten irradians]|uniref:golgin subfamily A member 6-like protein 1 n=1 Tax=Argopecten irradians TaxID=31199 RepID=UPI003713A691
MWEFMGTFTEWVPWRAERHLQYGHVPNVDIRNKWRSVGNVECAMPNVPIHRIRIQLLKIQKKDLDLQNTTIQNCIQDPSLPLKAILRKCNQRYLAFDNSQSTDKEEDARELIQLVCDITAKNGGKCYSNEMYEEAEKQYRRRLEEMKRQQIEEKELEKEQIRQTLQDNFQTQLEDLQREQNKSARESLTKENELHARITELEKRIKIAKRKRPNDMVMESNLSQNTNREMTSPAPYQKLQHEDWRQEQRYTTMTGNEEPYQKITLESSRHGRENALKNENYEGFWRQNEHLRREQENEKQTALMEMLRKLQDRFDKAVKKQWKYKEENQTRQQEYEERERKCREEYRRREQQLLAEMDKKYKTLLSDGIMRSKVRKEYEHERSGVISYLLSSVKTVGRGVAGLVKRIF